MMISGECATENPRETSNEVRNVKIPSSYT